MAKTNGVLSYETEGWEEAAEAQRMIEQSLTWTKRLLEKMGIKFA